MIRRPPRSTLFPTRRSSDLRRYLPNLDGRIAGRRCEPDRGHQHRSEEHTSELQSQSNLVCRLLLEKKKSTRHRLDAETPSVTGPLECAPHLSFGLLTNVRHA